MRRKLLISLGLIIATIAVYWQLSTYDFTGFDDPDYIINNHIVQKGLTPQTLSWALTTHELGFWQPLTWLSHALDCQLYGVKPGGHHITSVLLHLATAVLLFFVLNRMTGAFWKSAIVTALFALHPLHTETVAWIADRKDVLSAFFFMLALGSYVRYAEFRPDVSHGKPRVKWFGLALLFFAFSLMSKPALVTLPCVLLLLDFWPLGRMRALSAATERIHLRQNTTSRLLIEKVPFFLLAITMSVATYVVEKADGTVESFANIPLSVRISNALISYARYLQKTFWPSDLAVFYPHPGAWPLPLVIGATLLLVAVSVLVVARIRQQPFLAMGWFWFLGTLVPVIGIAQTWTHAMADRYTYVPLIGIFIAVVWGAESVLKHLPSIVRALTTTAALGACAVTTFFQVQHWKNTEALFRHTLAATGPNSTAHFALGNALMKTGKSDEALQHFQQAIGIKPDYAEAYSQVAHLLEMQGKFPEALANYREALHYKPNFPEALSNFAWFLAACPNDSIRNGAEAVRCATRACELTHYSEAAYVGVLGAANAEAGRFDDAVRMAEKALALAVKSGDEKLAAINSQFLQLYRDGHTVHWLMSQ